MEQLEEATKGHVQAVEDAREARITQAEAAQALLDFSTQDKVSAKSVDQIQKQVEDNWPAKTSATPTWRLIVRSSSSVACSLKYRQRQMTSGTPRMMC